jgi:hypothetical protein
MTGRRFFYAKNFVQNIVLEKSSISAISDIDAPIYEYLETLRSL